MKERLTEILDELADAIYAHTFADKISLFTGRAGSILLFGELYRATGKDKYYRYFSDTFQDVFGALHQQKKIDATLGNGISGLGWLLQSLNKYELLDRADEKTLQWFDDNIAAAIAADHRNKNYDLIYGLIGKGVYFLERFPEGESVKNLVTIVDSLVSLAEKCEDGFRWKNAYQEGYNLGLAHGIPSILIFFM